MTYVTSVERLGIQKGVQQERRYLIQRLLTGRCGEVSPETTARIQQLTMEHMADALLDFTGPDDLQAWLQTTR